MAGSKPRYPKFPVGGPKTLDVEASWLEPEESMERKPLRPPPIPGANRRVPPMPGGLGVSPKGTDEPVRRVTMQVKAEWLEPLLTDAPPSKRKKSRASLAPVKIEDKKHKKAPPIPREE